MIGNFDSKLPQAITDKINAMHTAHGSDLAKLHGGAVGYAQSLVDQGGDPQIVENAESLATQAYVSRSNYFLKSLIARQAFVAWYVTAFYMVMGFINLWHIGSLEIMMSALTWLAPTWLMATLAIWLTIGFKGLRGELGRHKWAWIIALGFWSAFWILVSLNGHPAGGHDPELLL